jgi:DNA-binding transcriptional LysR family regulator
VADLIRSRQQQAAVTLAETLNYVRAARRLGISVLELRSQIKALEGKLCLHIFEPQVDQPALTEDGRYLVQAFRKALRRNHEL